ncbi:aspartate aminotransferase family protein [Rhizobium ruizarguesonis]|uniref:Aminotransferase class III-fold pyridoxal phosphate-dependent enzyme n=2 Tax=Rhizobium ruizarguesonis TaxID=2081791 RepID=A0AAE8QEM5_9HYPH|nr:aspartate aminotransferase family protein [Rhizobium ruizarguesonis]MCB2405927.1 aspartate aminotransferase family protein [Rhizobium ruizarguesonis]NEI52837.1 aminotransferase class III-fold pyridoxal phosphate-dependent enzyme [Rhizobium ruizarguesonis]TBD01351.1 aspartate aminotransferase family protein [Rhizobium ruizarguesonis]TBD17497.1 aspartate aminotransferase family protein [Rhizobium ruizarguesonis]TBD44094.1 aspartate aminotransferase family protein [Rhizobium ruizarguesonis]
MRETNFLTENNARHVWHPMAHPADMLANPPRIIRAASGVEITDIDGKTVLDGVGGLWNVNLGYSCDPIKQAIRDQLEELPYYSAFRGTTNPPLIELSYELAEWFKEDGLSRSFFTSGGSDSVETCLRLARQYHKVNGQPERTKFVALKKGYHGTHFGGASVNGNANNRRNYEPLLPGVSHLAAPYGYRNPFGTDDPAEIAAAIGRQFEDEIAFQGADTIAAFIMEPVLGAGGIMVPHETFMPLMRAICDKNGILLIADEVITAFGRTGAWTGSRLWGIRPDLMSTAKAITNGYYPFGAVMIADKIAEAFEANKNTVGTIGHGYTYSGHPVGAAAALATLKETKRLNVAANAGARGNELLAGLNWLKEKHELIGDVRGKGLMCALELVTDRATKTGAPKDMVQRLQDAAYDAGVMVRTSGSNVIISPPLVITTADVDRILAALETGLTAAAGGK